MCATDNEICHSTKSSLRVEVKEHVLRINRTQSFMTSLGELYFLDAGKTYRKARDTDDQNYKSTKYSFFHLKKSIFIKPTVSSTVY